MRELPEPDGEHDRVFDRGTVVYKKESVLAIQKQAYEDGLRDARRMRISSEMLQAGAEEFDGWAKENQGTYECLEAVYRAMLTASQKEQQ